MGTDVIARLRDELIAVICRHTKIDKDALKVTSNTATASRC